MARAATAGVLPTPPSPRPALAALVACLVFACTAAPERALGQPQVKAEELLTRVGERARQQKSKPPQREFMRTKTTLQLDKHQSVKSREELTYHMVIINGALYPRLLLKNGQPLTSADQKKEEEKEARFRAAREDNPGKQEEEGNTVLLKISEEDARRFDFAISGREEVNCRPAWVVTVTPKAGLPARTTEHQVMSHISGRLWIDEAESEIARLEVNLLKPVHFGLGILGALNQFQFSVLRNRLPDGEWENSLVKLGLHFRVLIDSVRIQYEEKVSPLGLEE